MFYNVIHFWYCIFKTSSPICPETLWNDSQRNNKYKKIYIIQRFFQDFRKHLIWKVVNYSCKALHFRYLWKSWTRFYHVVMPQKYVTKASMENIWTQIFAWYWNLGWGDESQFYMFLHGSIYVKTFKPLIIVTKLSNFDVFGSFR